MLRGCYTLIQVFEMLLGIWIIYNLYPEFRKEGRLIQGLWIIGCLIMGIVYVWSAWNSYISNIAILVCAVIFSLMYRIFLKVNFLNIFLLEVLYLTSISFLNPHAPHLAPP